MTLAKFSKLSNFNPEITSLDLSFFYEKSAAGILGSTF
jgi:hypothetical protein